MTIVIEGNKGINIGGDLINAVAPHQVDLTISHNIGQDVTGDLINVRVYIDSESLGSFTTEAEKHLTELSPNQQEGFRKAVDSLKTNNEDSNKKAVCWLRDLSVSIPGSLLASVILKFLNIDL